MCKTLKGAVKKFLGMSLIMFGIASATYADPVGEDAAKKMLFSTKGYSIQVSSKLTEAEQTAIRQLVPLMGKQLREPVRYYAAIAYSPGDGLVHESIQAAMNHHTTQAASNAAVAACNKLRSKGTPKCQVAAVVVPKKYKKRELSLSIDATAAFNKSFKKTKGPKVFAISPSTGVFAHDANESKALNDCNANASGVDDCEIVIQE